MSASLSATENRASSAVSTTSAAAASQAVHVASNIAAAAIAAANPLQAPNGVSKSSTSGREFSLGAGVSAGHQREFRDFTPWLQEKLRTRMR